MLCQSTSGILNAGGNEQLENYEMGKGKYETGSVRMWCDATVNDL